MHVDQGSPGLLLRAGQGRAAAPVAPPAGGRAALTLSPAAPRDALCRCLPAAAPPCHRTQASSPSITDDDDDASSSSSDGFPSGDDDSSGEESSDDEEGEAFEQVDVDFGFYCPQEKDFQGLRMLLQGYLDGQQWACSDLVDAIIQQVCWSDSVQHTSWGSTACLRASRCHPSTAGPCPPRPNPPECRRAAPLRWAA